MKLMTEVFPGDYPFRIGHREGILMMGSCFTDNIGRMMERYRFPVTVNPFGTIYNPLSVKTGLDALLGKEKYTIQDLDRHDGTWFSFDHYTGFSSNDREECLERINRSFLPAKEVLLKAGMLILSWGTAWVYRDMETSRVVSNCHKIPAKRFSRIRLGVEEIAGEYAELLRRLFEVNEHIQVLLTVSPVRHWKDGPRENQLSKGVLLLATAELERLFPDRVFYFPSYEIVMDELRDYRYYAGDLLHLNETAVRYIWEKFSGSLVDGESRDFIADLEPLIKLREHRPKDTGPEAIGKLEEKEQQIQDKLRKKYSFIDT